MGRDNYLVFTALLVFSFSLFNLASTYNLIINFGSAVTGFATDSGVVNLTVGSVVSINFTNASVNFGSGEVNSSATFATINTLGSVVNGTWAPETLKFLIINLGNENATLNFSSGKNASTFIGGNVSIASYQYNVSNVETGACVPPAGFSLGTFYEVNTTPVSREICADFLPGKNITIDIKLVIPDNSNLGILTDTVTITYEAS